jgi:GT2 family glycosyltransferase
VSIRIATIIVNHRTAELSLQCLDSLNAGASGTINTAIVDNCSGDESVATIAETIERRGWQDWARVVSLAENGGFSSGNNAGIRLALAFDPPPAYVLLLNPDTVVKPGAIAALVDFMERHPRIGIAGSSLEDGDGRPQCSAHRFPTPGGELLVGARLGLLDRLMPRRVLSPPIQPEPHPCDWVSGASMIIRREVFEQIGLLDEGYFLYFEEVDFCFRARKAGWDVWYVPQSRVVHLEGASTGIRAQKKRRPAYWYNSRRRFFLKSYGIVGLLIADCLWAVGRLSWWTRRCIGLAKPANDPKRFAWDLLGGDLRSLFSGARDGRAGAI